LKLLNYTYRKLKKVESRKFPIFRRRLIRSVTLRWRTNWRSSQYRTVSIWILDLFRDHAYCTKFAWTTSAFDSIYASVIQGSAIGPASYIVTAYWTNQLAVSLLTDLSTGGW